MESLEVGLDLGSGYSAMVARHLDGKNTSKTATVETLNLSNSLDSDNSQIKSIALYRHDMALVCGSDVYKTLSANPDLQDEVMELCKLALHSEFDDLAEVGHVKRVLSTEKDRGAMQDFFTNQLQCFALGVREYYKQEVTEVEGHDSNTYWDNIPLVFQISVPAMWDDSQRGIIRNAARKAGIAKVELREEPLCVATACIPERINKKQIKEGQCMILVDCGKGTLDIATVMLLRLESADHDLELKRIGLCSGNGFGAHTPNRLFWDWICSGQCPGVPNLQEECRKLRITEREFMRQASEQFDRIKEEFKPDKRGHTVTILGADGIEEAANRLAISIEQVRVQGWHDQWTSGATELLEEHIAQVTKFAAETELELDFALAMLTGGGSRSGAFKDAMQLVLSKPQYKNIKVKFSTLTLLCAQGTLMQHVFKEDRLPPVSHFHIARTELYTPVKHRKADAQRSQWDTNEEIVNDRLHCIISYKNEEFFGQSLVPMTFCAPADGTLGRLHVDLYWSKQRFRSGTALKDHDGKMKAGIRRYPLVFADVGNLAERGFKPENVAGESHFLVKGWIETVGTRDQLEILLYVMKYGYEYQRVGQQMSIKIPRGSGDLNKDDILQVYPEDVWDKDSSHFVSSSTGQLARD